MNTLCCCCLFFVRTPTRCWRMSCSFWFVHSFAVWLLISIERCSSYSMRCEWVWAFKCPICSQPPNIIMTNMNHIMILFSFFASCFAATTAANKTLTNQAMFCIFSDCECVGFIHMRSVRCSIEDMWSVNFIDPSLWSLFWAPTTGNFIRLCSIDKY